LIRGGLRPKGILKEKRKGDKKKKTTASWREHNPLGGCSAGSIARRWGWVRRSTTSEKKEQRWKGTIVVTPSTKKKMHG